MKAKTKIGNGYAYFAYESYNGFRRYGKFAELAKYDNNGGYIVGFLYCPFYGVTEKIDELEIQRKPTLTEIKNFIANCYKALQ